MILMLGFDYKLTEICSMALNFHDFEKELIFIDLLSDKTTVNPGMLTIPYPSRVEAFILFSMHVQFYLISLIES
jgi:hypothetical protein